MIKEFKDISQSIIADFLDHYKSNLIPNDEKNDINFKLNVDSTNYMELQYYILLLHSLYNINKGNDKFKVSTTLTSNIRNNSKGVKRQRGEDWGKINTFLSCFSDTFFRNRNIFDEKTFGKLQLQSPKSINFGRLIPLIPVNLDTYEFLAQRVEVAFWPVISKTSEKHLCCKNTVHNKEIRTIDKNGKIHKRVKRTFKIRFNDSDFHSAARNVIHTACMNYLFSYDNRSTLDDYFELFNERTNHYSSKEFFSKIKDISVLSLLIFSAYNRFNLIERLDNIKNASKYKGLRKKYTKEVLAENSVYPDHSEDDFVLSNAQDMADGLLQLIENTVFHAGTPGKQDGYGVLSIRIFKKGQQSKENLQNSTYKYFFDGHDNRCQINQDNLTAQSSFFQYRMYDNKNANELTQKEFDECKENLKQIELRRLERDSSSYHLEVRLLDNSGKNMCNVFLNNHEHDDTPCPFNNSSDYIMKVSSFFNPDENEREKWRVFNKESDNVIHHYGLQLFDAMLQSIDGCFIVQSIADSELPNHKNFYSTSGDQLANNVKKYMTGTQYSILLPFILEHEKPFSFINTNVEFPLPSGSFTLDNRENNPNIKSFTDMLLGYKNLPYSSSEEKKNCILSLFEPLSTYKPDNNTIIVIDAKYLSTQNSELFAKALVKFIAKKRKREINVAIKNCHSDIFKQLARTFAMFYDRDGRNEIMSKSQIYLSGIMKDSANSYVEEFRLAGSNIHDTLTAQIKLDAARGLTREVHGGIISFLTNMLKRRPGTGTSELRVKYVPFDLLIKTNGISVFEHNVNKILTTSVQQYNSGCALSPNHMRIGSKIHVDKFYEAKILFDNNYYTERFAWLIKEQIKNTNLPPCKEDSPYLFVGYESYSEILLYNICNQFSYSEYCIFEYGVQDAFGKASKDRFRRLNRIEDGKVYQVVYIVPINSTLSTFDKLQATFIKAVEKCNDDSSKTRLNISSKAGYFGVIQTRHGNSKTVEKEELNYFESINIEKRTIKSKILLNQEVYYLFCVQANWMNPLQCKQCYPADNHYLEEVPLIETDKTSITPAQLYGLQSALECKLGNPDFCNFRGDIAELYGNVLYNHTFRGSNHFQYYIDTEGLFEEASKIRVNEKPKIDNWLGEVRKKIVDKKKIRFDIIVCPEHYSNSGFIKRVNDIVFGGASLVVSINSSKEYRDNFKAKHSDISNVIDNLVEQHIIGEINFHYVDDTIVHGKSFSRVQSLVNSICYNKNHNIKMNVFKSIILLLNRNSNDSKRNYIKNNDNYFAYLDLSISSLRTHNNACVLCQDVTELRLLSKRSALNTTRKHIIDKVKHLSKKNVLEFTSINKKEYMALHYHDYVQMICTHYFNNALSKIVEKNYRTSSLLVLLDLIVASIKKAELNRDDNANKKLPTPDNLTLIKSYILAVSSPFQSFRKSTREAVFKLILFVFEVLLSNQYEDKQYSNIVDRFINNNIASEHELEEKTMLLNIKEQLSSNLSELVNYINEIKKIESDKNVLLHVLMEQSVALKSNYIIRLDNVIRILSFGIADKTGKLSNDDKANDFIERYLLQIKRLIASSSDKVKAMYVEYMILSGTEFPKKYSKINNPYNSVFKSFGILEESFIKLNIDKYRTNSSAAYQNKVTKYLKKLVNCIFLENTQIIYDAIRDIKNHKKSDDMNRLYFLENYKNILCWNGQDNLFTYSKLDTDSMTIQLVELYEHLHKNDDEYSINEGIEYYTILLGYIKNIVKTDEVFLFMVDGNTNQLFPNDSYPDSDIVEHVYNKAFQNTMSNIGNTYYFDEATNIRIIRLFDNKKEVVHIEWLLVYKTKSKNRATDLSELINVRNLLTLKNTILMRIMKDFDNNHSPDYIELKEKVFKLSSEKTGSHTPFKELSDYFNLIYNTLYDSNLGIKNNGIGEQLKLISDSIISKLYVLSITGKLPDQIDPDPLERDSYYLKDYYCVLQQAENLSIKEGKGVIRPKINNMELLNSCTKLSVPNKSGFIWCCAYIALILNALRHGKKENMIVEININVVRKNGVKCVQLDNKKSKKSNKVNEKIGFMTLSSIKYFFNEYGYNAFEWDYSNQEFFIVWLPLEASK